MLKAISLFKKHIIMQKMYYYAKIYFYAKIHHYAKNLSFWKKSYHNKKHIFMPRNILYNFAHFFGFDICYLNVIICHYIYACIYVHFVCHRPVLTLSLYFSFLFFGESPLCTHTRTLLEKIIEKNPFLDKESYLILTLVNKITFLYIFH